MSTPVLKVKVIPKTIIRGRMDVRFPASVSAESPILLDKIGGTFAFSFDMNAVIQSVTFAGFVSGPASAVDGNIPQFDGTTGKKLKDGKAAPTGDIVGTTDTQTLTHKTINAPDNTITNLATSMFAANVVDNDGTLAANSSTRIPTQAAVKAYADQVVAATDAIVFKGVIDCSANPNYPAADRGWTYKVSVAGKIGGASGVTVEAGDTLMCLTDGTAAGNQATVGANWNIVQANLVGAVTGPASSTSGRIATFNGTGGTVIQDGGKSIADLDTAAQTHAATSKTTPVDADELPLVDSAASNVLKKLAFSDLKAAVLSSPTVAGAVTINSPVNNSLVVYQATGTVAGRFQSGAASGPSGGVFFNIFCNDSAALANGDRLGGLGFGGSFDASGASTNATPITITGFATENWASGSTGARLEFQTTPNGSGSRGTVAAFHGSGGVSVGSTTDPGSGNLGTSGGVVLGSFTVATLPTGATGKAVFCSNCRVFNGSGTQEGSGAGTGGLVVYNGTAWKIAGTNVTAVA